MARDEDSPSRRPRGRVTNVVKGAFLTDGTRLVEVVEVVDDKVMIEDAVSAVEDPVVGELELEDARTNWKRVRKAARVV